MPATAGQKELDCSFDRLLGALPVRDLTTRSVRDLLAIQAGVTLELKRRQLCRTSNNPIADIAEWLVAQAFDLELVNGSTAGFDAKSASGERYEVKARRVSSISRPTHLSAIRGLDGQHFDFFVVVLFGDDFSILQATKLTFDAVKRIARFRKHINGHLVYLSDIRKATDALDVTSQIASVLDQPKVGKDASR